MLLKAYTRGRYGRGAPFAACPALATACRLRIDSDVLVQFVYAGKKAALTIGNIKPIGEMPEGTIVSNVEAVSLPLCAVAWHYSCLALVAFMLLLLELGLRCLCKGL